MHQEKVTPTLLCLRMTSHHLFCFSRSLHGNEKLVHDEINVLKGLNHPNVGKLVTLSSYKQGQIQIHRALLSSWNIFYNDSQALRLV
jgi:hypothetical protein